MSGTIGGREEESYRSIEYVVFVRQALCQAICSRGRIRYTPYASLVVPLSISSSRRSLSTE